MKRAPCDRCRYTPGIVKVMLRKHPGDLAFRWERCHCGRMPSNTNQAKIDRQYKLDVRLRELKEGKPW